MTVYWARRVRFSSNPSTPNSLFKLLFKMFVKISNYKVEVSIDPLT